MTQGHVSGTRIVSFPLIVSLDRVPESQNVLFYLQNRPFSRPQNDPKLAPEMAPKVPPKWPWIGSWNGSWSEKSHKNKINILYYQRLLYQLVAQQMLRHLYHLVYSPGEMVQERPRGAPEGPAGPLPEDFSGESIMTYPVSAYHVRAVHTSLAI